MSNDAYISDDDRPDESDAEMADHVAWHEQQKAEQASKRVTEMFGSYVDGQIKALRKYCPA